MCYYIDDECYDNNRWTPSTHSSVHAEPRIVESLDISIAGHVDSTAAPPTKSLYVPTACNLLFLKQRRIDHVQLYIHGHLHARRLHANSFAKQK